MTYRIHDLAPLRREVKTNATRARELRQEARATSHDERHWLKVEANGHGANTRHPHLAHGYLRGRTIDQMESETTRPDNLPSARGILAWASESFLKGPDAPEWDREDPEAVPSGWMEFKAKVEADIKAWHARCLAANALKDARKAAKRAAVA